MTGASRHAFNKPKKSDPRPQSPRVSIVARSLRYPDLINATLNLGRGKGKEGAAAREYLQRFSNTSFFVPPVPRTHPKQSSTTPTPTNTTTTTSTTHHSLPPEWMLSDYDMSQFKYIIDLEGQVLSTQVK